MSEPPFVMSKYASELDLLRDKCAWLEKERDRVIEAAQPVCWFDWSNNDSDAVAAVERLRTALQENAARQIATIFVMGPERYLGGTEGVEAEEATPDPLVTRIERMRGAIADARARIVQHFADSPARGAILAFLDDASYDTKYGNAPTVRAMRPERYLGGIEGQSTPVDEP